MPKLKIDDPILSCEDLKDNGIPHKVISTHFTRTIIVNSEKFNFINTSDFEFEDEEIYYFSSNESKLSMRELNLIKMVKSYCETLNKRVRVNRKNINYFKVNNFKNGIYKRDLWEIDLNAAYWNLAYKYGFISKQIYFKGMNLDEDGNKIEPIYNKYGRIINHVSKMSRLIALGNLAKLKTHFYFDGIKYSSPVPERSDLTENYFFKVSLETDSIMKVLTMLAGEDYLFYWVDAIFVRSEQCANFICDYLTNEIGMNFKLVKLNKLQKTNSYIRIWDETNTDQDGNLVPRPFIFKPISNKVLRNVLDTGNDIIRKETISNFLTIKQK